jgi:pilus assembly protein CpaB
MAAKQKTVVILGVFAVVLALIASLSLYNYLKKQEAEVQQAVATSKVAVASSDIPIGTTIQANLVKVIDWPRANQPQGAFNSLEQVVGRTVKDPYTAGEPILESKLVPKEGQGGILTYKIPEGHRAMTVAVDQVSGVAGFIAPGSMVDVVLTTTPPGAGQPISRIVLQNVPILATGQILSEQKKDEKPQVVPTVTVDVTPEDAEKLAIASTQGRLQLVLRRVGDKEVAKTTGATVARVVGLGAPKAEAKEPRIAVHKRVAAPVQRAPEPFSVEVWRGDKKAVRTFKEEGQ